MLGKREGEGKSTLRGIRNRAPNGGTGTRGSPWCPPVILRGQKQPASRPLNAKGKIRGGGDAMGMGKINIRARKEVKMGKTRVGPGKPGLHRQKLAKGI